MVGSRSTPNIWLSTMEDVAKFNTFLWTIFPDTAVKMEDTNGCIEHSFPKISTLVPVGGIPTGENLLRKELVNNTGGGNH